MNRRDRTTDEENTVELEWNGMEKKKRVWGRI